MTIEDKIADVFSTEEMIPSAGQGVIALQCRSDDEKIISLCESTKSNIYFSGPSAKNYLDKKKFKTKKVNLKIIKYNEQKIYKQTLKTYHVYITWLKKHQKTNK